MQLLSWVPKLSLGVVKLLTRDMPLALPKDHQALINPVSPQAPMLLQVSEDLAHQEPHKDLEDLPSLALLVAPHSVVLPTAHLVLRAHSDLLSQEALVDLVLQARPMDLLHHLDLISQEAPLDLLLLKDLLAQAALELLVNHLDLPDPVLPALPSDLDSQPVLKALKIFVALELLAPHKVLVVPPHPLNLVLPTAHRLLQVYLHPVVQVVQDNQALLLLLVHQALLPLLVTLRLQISLVPLKDLLLLVHQMDPLALLDLKIL